MRMHVEPDMVPRQALRDMRAERDEAIQTLELERAAHRVTAERLAEAEANCKHHGALLRKEIARADLSEARVRRAHRALQHLLDGGYWTGEVRDILRAIHEGLVGADI